MNMPRAARFHSEIEPNRRTPEDALDDIGGDQLPGSGLEPEAPEPAFEEGE
jgi:hypothetical protein